jgi:hypothetical protein
MTASTFPATGPIVPIAAAAEQYGVHPRTLRRWGAAGRIALFRFGPRLLKVDLAEVEAQLRQIPTAGAS